MDTAHCARFTALLMMGALDDACGSGQLRHLRACPMQRLRSSGSTQRLRKSRAQRAKRRWILKAKKVASAARYRCWRRRQQIYALCSAPTSSAKPASWQATARPFKSTTRRTDAFSSATQRRATSRGSRKCRCRPRFWCRYRGMRPQIDGPIVCDSITWNDDGYYVVMLRGSSDGHAHELHMTPAPADSTKPYTQQRMRLLAVKAWSGRARPRRSCIEC